MCDVPTKLYIEATPRTKRRRGSSKIMDDVGVSDIFDQSRRGGPCETNVNEQHGSAIWARAEP